MSGGPRYYTPKTLKRLYGLSGNQCSFPGCTKRLVNANNALDSNICHIEAALLGGERYNQSMSDEERADYPNLILLCVQHHEETNNFTVYTVEALREMKRNHESQFLTERLKNNPSMLKNAINAIAGINIDDLIEPDSLNVIDPKSKMAYNSIKRNVSLIQEYKIYSQKVNSLYDELEKQGSIKKEKLLSNIKTIYTQIKGKYVLDNPNPIEVIRQNADDIFDDVYAYLYSKMEESDLFEEDIVLGINIIMVDAFTRCKILEETV